MKLHELHVELTERCNADCPMCGRTQSGGKPNPNLADRELSLDDFRSFLPVSVLRELSLIRFCGNFGDPVAARDLLEIVEYLRSLSAALNIQIHSNGGLRSAKWWYQLGRLLGRDKNAVFFGIDGSELTNHLYRRGVRWEVLMRNVEAFLRAGGRAHWVLLAFEHNEHEIERLREHARGMGFEQFTVKASKRFLKTRDFELNWTQPVFDSNGEKLYEIRPPNRSELRNPLLLEVEQAASGALERTLQAAPIACRALQPPGLFLSAEGLVFPCCWTAASIYPSYANEPCGEIWELLQATGGTKQIDFRQTPLEQVPASAFFTELSHRWGVADFASGKPRICARICSVGPSMFDSQFNHHVLRDSTQLPQVLHWL